MAAMTSVQNSPAITLLPTGPGGPTSLNPVYQQCDPTNGNFFTTTNRDLVTFYLYPATSAPAYNPTLTYTKGQVVNSGGTAYIANTSVPLATPPPAAQWTVYTDASANVTLYSAPDACTGRKSDVDNYNVPLGAGSVEFLVLPSSVFTQANGQFQFLASSDRIFVYVRNL
jgi:hypothetical protein